MTDDRIPTADIDEVFGLVANELRIEVLTELWERRGDPQSFSELQSRVGVRDSGKFNYHLNVLVPEFVARSDDGYRLTHAGEQVIGAAVSGGFTDADGLDVGPVPAGECPSCGAELRARYDGGDVVVDCAACDELIAHLPVPPITVAGVDSEALPARISTYLLTQAQGLARGFCKLCDGRAEAALTALTPEESVTHDPSLNVRFECRECGDVTNLNVGAVVADHPAVQSFLFDAGIDPRETYVWELVPLLDPDATVTSEDPLRLRLRIRIDDRTLELTLDESATVLEHERT